MSSEKEKKELTEKQRAFIEALGDPEVMGDLRKAARKAGYSDKTKMSEILPSIADAVREASKEFLAQNSFKAAWAIIGTMTNPNDAGATTRLKAAESLLSRVGVKESEVAVNIPKSGVVILPAKSVRVEDDDSES